jgi:A/G-specific adenine glycosylase
LRGLPGIGVYTSAAIAAIACEDKAAAVDTNVERVIARFHRIERPRRADLERLVAGMMSGVSPADLTQAMMDLGATICRPRAPHCGACPLRDSCAARVSGRPEAFPAPRERKARPHRHGIAWWIERDGRLWLVRRPAKGLLGGMAGLPGSEWSEAGVAPADTLAAVRHVFTHFSLDLHVVERLEPVGEGWWQPLSTLAVAGLPTLYAKAAEEMLKRRRLRAA